MCSHINIGTGEDISIKELAQVIKQITGFRGNIVFDTDKPDGTPRKLLDVSKINKLGWRSSISLMDGVLDTYNWYLKNINSFRGL
jgi:GDP-L-fucose synthase